MFSLFEREPAGVWLLPAGFGFATCSFTVGASVDAGTGVGVGFAAVADPETALGAVAAASTGFWLGPGAPKCCAWWS